MATTKKATKRAAGQGPARRLRTTWTIERPINAGRNVPFVARDGTGACAWASRREAIEAAERDQGAPWVALAATSWRIRRVTGIASELAR